MGGVCVCINILLLLAQRHIMLHYEPIFSCTGTPNTVSHYHIFSWCYHDDDDGDDDDNDNDNNDDDDED